ncbi:hypothetical protein TCAL_07119 [Tigriopus californicus]|uniref:Apple domain-containing protein n=1 Tax=Tigriopus californicus TaxID=6832 RepID=A0A553PAT3_TIGCA|nr:uncharacterized protein LOC131892969 [Tigriopus californicus]TRY74795.1 hypothetical protein TCAL_07119 [Tigriopus californicus]
MRQRSVDRLSEEQDFTVENAKKNSKAKEKKAKRPRTKTFPFECTNQQVIGTGMAIVCIGFLVLISALHNQKFPMERKNSGKPKAEVTFGRYLIPSEKWNVSKSILDVPNWNDCARRCRKKAPGNCTAFTFNAEYNICHMGHLFANDTNLIRLTNGTAPEKTASEGNVDYTDVFVFHNRTIL